VCNVFDTFAQHRPVAARRILAAANMCVMVVPAATILAIVTGHLILAQVGVFANIASYAIGYAAAGLRYGRWMRAAVTEARRDPLTGLPTRAVADEILGAATGDATPLTVALADIDGLHAINTIGLAAGDQYIKVIAERLARAVPSGGCLVRQGGDEFTLLAPGTDPDALATAIGAAMAGPAVIAGYRIQPRVSVGIAHRDRDGDGDGNYARACADAAMYSAKAAGGNHIMVYQADRDGQPSPDGTRPLIRRRDIDPLAHDGVAWLPTPGDDLWPLLVSADEARTLGEAVAAARDRWAKAGAEAQAGAQRPESPPSTEPDRINIEPTPAGYRGIARIAADQHARHTRLADRLTAIIDAAQAHGEGGHARKPSAGANRVVLVGISAAFTPIEIEGLVRTAADALYGNPDDLSVRQRDLAARANALLREEMQG
jgi:diguanylate cyclase (GGDEF)-like protein